MNVIVASVEGGELGDLRTSSTALLAVLSARVFAVLPSMKPAPAESDAEPRKRTEGGAL
jgi:hypothetical protein